MGNETTKNPISRNERNIVLNLLDREIGTQDTKYSSSKGSYRHPYQLVAPFAPRNSFKISFNDLETNSGLIKFESLANCLGFSPDGRLVAFHSHARSRVSILDYCGVEGLRPNEQKVDVKKAFYKRLDVNVMRPLMDFSYIGQGVEASWWTDDSEAIILHFKMESMPESRDVIEQEEREYDYDEDLALRIEEMRRLVLYRGLHVRDRANNPEAVAEDEEEEEDEEEAEEQEEIEVVDEQYTPVESVSTELSSNGEQRLIERSEESAKSEEEDVPKYHQSTETSRTVPFYCAVCSSSEQAYDGDLANGECSRTMTVYHAITSSMLNEKDNTDPNGESEESSSRPEPDLKRAKVEEKSQREEPVPVEKEQPFASMLKDAIKNKESLDHDVKEDPRADTKFTFVFIAVNACTGQISMCDFINTRKGFNFHIRDRQLVVVSNNDYVETYRLMGASWRIVDAYKISPLICMYSCPIYYQNGNIPGRASSVVHRSGMILGDFYNPYAFYSPIQQNAKALLYRDEPEWFGRHPEFASQHPLITRCHQIRDDIIAFTVTYHKPHDEPINQGLVLKKENKELSFYPDYREYLQLLFTHHMADLVPRQWTYLSPNPITTQEWFKKAYIDIFDPEQMNNYEKLLRTYDFLTAHINCPKSTSSPFVHGKFNPQIKAEHFLYTYIYRSNDGTRDLPNDPFTDYMMSKRNKFYHPHDPLTIVNVHKSWQVVIPDAAPEDSTGVLLLAEDCEQLLFTSLLHSLPTTMRNSAPLRELHVALVGMSGSGKSAVAVKYITKRFIGEYDSTLEDNYCRQETVGGQCLMVWMMDTVESATKDEMRWIAWADVYVVVYDVTSQLSFQYSEGILERIARHEHVLCPREHRTLLVGNKSDLERYRQVSETEGERLASQHKAYFAECSAASDLRQFTQSLHSIFQYIISGARSPSPRQCSSDSEIITPRKGAFSSLRSSSRSSQVRAKTSTTKTPAPLHKTPSLSKLKTGSKLLKLFHT
ncbi:unnamed protein product [Caenorhabditis sp. 36 PRJEB53466]|nr:unnamed protein product [Caenorhabditis sp. 36 PRJEB53466]